ncbi:MAG: LytR/AlgR family response regulator transcription factor, partial [Acetivibrio ethanolgignens]
CYEFTPIVFVTSILSLELQSYRELQCYRYITKPFDRTEVAAIIEKVLLHSLEQREEASVTIKKDGINYKLSCDDILFIQAISRGVRLVLKTEELAVRYLTLKQLLPKLPQDEFLQCHRMYIVNQRYIEYVDTVNRMIKIRGSKEPVEIGVTYKTQIRSLLHE